MRPLLVVVLVALASSAAAMPFPTWESLKDRDPLCHFTIRPDGKIVCTDMAILSVVEPQSSAPRSYRCQQVFTNHRESGCIAVPSNDQLVTASILTTDH